MKKLAEGYGLVEGPLWHAERGLIFSDVLHGGVFAVKDTCEVNDVFAHRRGIGGIALHADNGLIVSGRNVSFKPFDGGDTILLLDRNEDAGVVGYNDLTTDSLGRIYVGSLGSSPVFNDGLEPRAGDLVMIDLDGQSIKVAEDIMLTNGLAFSPDGKTLYHSDTSRKVVNRYDVYENGLLGAKQVFAEVETGVPDGLVVSTDGSVWVALARGGHGVAVFASNGSLTAIIEIPQPMCTSVCFGGVDLKTLYLVSGSEGMDSDHAGAVYSMETDVAGCTVAPARVKLSSS